MATNILVPGASLLYLGNGSGGFNQLGYVEEDAPIQFIGSHGDVNADYAGPSMPADVQYFGEGAMISLTLIRYNEVILNQLKARIQGGSPGQGGAGSIGTLLVAEGKTVPFVVVSNYGTYGAAAKTVFTNANMNSAFYFPQIYAADSFDFSLSTKAKRERLILRAIPVIGVNGSFTTYQIGLPNGVTLPAPN